VAPVRRGALSSSVVHCFPDADAEAKAALSTTSKGRLVKLWTYGCPLAQGRAVTCLAWNRVNPDLLAVSYGEIKIVPKEGEEPPMAGIILFWSMSNPNFPQATLFARSGVTSIAFSGTHPNLIAAGLQDGSVCIYDVKKVTGVVSLKFGLVLIMAHVLTGHVWRR
jgi:WD40 repeat protein